VRGMRRREAKGSAWERYTMGDCPGVSIIRGWDFMYSI
jgi:hypothetical protein